MVKKLVRQMLAAQIVSALTVSVCLMIDSIMIGRFLGVRAVAAYGLANPVLLAIGAIGSILAAGIQVACGKSLGRGSQEETNAGYSSALAAVAAISLAFMAIVLLIREPLADWLGAGKSGKLHEDTSAYMEGFIIGAPGSMAALVLVPFLQMAGQSGLLIAAVLTMTVTDIALDLLNVLVLHWEMFGMGLASSLSYYAAMTVAAVYFLSKKCVFRFSFKRVTLKKIGELFAGGVPAGFNMASNVLLIFVVNKILKASGEHAVAAVAAFSVINTIGNASCCINTGIGGVSLTLAGIFYNEEDRTSLKELIRCLSRSSLLLGGLMGIALCIFAPQLVHLFIPGRLAVTGLRLYALGLIPCCIVNMLKNMYQATGKPIMTELISLFEVAALPICSTLVMTALMGVTGAWLFFVCGETLALALILIYIRAKSGRAPWKDGAYLLLGSEFGVTEENLYETVIHTEQDVLAASEAAERFCVSHGQSSKISNHIMLCIEEMAGNVIAHGFSKDERPHSLYLRILKKPGHWVLRFRDDCHAFDPVSYVPAEGKDALGIRLVLALTSEAAYTYSLNFNNLTLILNAD
ncbi:MAG: hypothetical protein IKR85_11525 [Clostridia bacterium]|nr:hypothetical protein [Clostridia bacterium]